MKTLSLTSALRHLSKPSFKFLLVWRLINAFLVNTYFQADEFWQSLEPAHLQAFGYGELTWEWKNGLRSYAHPFIFEMGYRLVKLISTLCPETHRSSVEYYGVLYTPKVICAVLAAIGEYYTVALTRKVYLLTAFSQKWDWNLDADPDTKKRWLDQLTQIVTLLTCTNFFNWFFGTRAFVNSFEMVLTVVALYHWNWAGEATVVRSFEFTESLFFAMLACFVRASSAIIWIVLGGLLVISLLSKRYFGALITLLFKVALTFSIVLAINVTIDYYFYGKLVFPVFEFVKFNFTTPLAKFYGVAPWNFYLVQGLPILLTYAFIPFVSGMLTLPIFSGTTPFIGNFCRPLHQIRIVILVNLLIYSLLPHKEFRFIYPLQPLLIIVAVYGVGTLKRSLQTLTSSRILQAVIGFLSKLVVLLALALSIILTYFNESGVIKVMKFLHNEPHIESLGFIMPCHSTPWQSYLHRNDIGNLWAITCEPPLQLLDDPDAAEKLPSYMDESDYLYADVPKFIRTYIHRDNEAEWLPTAQIMGSGAVIMEHIWPEYLVVFQALDEEFLREYMETELSKDGIEYVEWKRFFNSFWHWDSRRSGDVIVYKRQSSSKHGGTDEDIEWFISELEYSDVPDNLVTVAVNAVTSNGTDFH